MSGKARKAVPFEFVLDLLAPLSPETRPMFGCLAVYVDERIVLILRDRENDATDDNGVWLATQREHHESLRRELPQMRSIRVLGSGETHWQNIPVDEPGFEEAVHRVCALIRSGDPRIGKVPKRRSPKPGARADSARGSIRRSARKAPKRKARSRGSS